MTGKLAAVLKNDELILLMHNLSCLKLKIYTILVNIYSQKTAGEQTFTVSRFPLQSISFIINTIKLLKAFDTIIAVCKNQALKNKIEGRIINKFQL